MLPVPSVFITLCLINCRFGWLDGEGYRGNVVENVTFGLQTTVLGDASSRTVYRDDDVVPI